jgi:arabinose-5-phosphate isomerase
MVPARELAPLAPDAPLPAVIAHLTQGSPSRGTLGASWVHAPGDLSQLAGLITDGDLRRTLQRHPPEEWGQVTAAQMATADPISVGPDELAATALELMERNPRKPISVLAVVEADRARTLTGLLRLHDLVQAGFSRTGP